ncbi:MAG: FtsX-like permease family protein [Verrucomicrobiota bacterium]
MTARHYLFRSLLHHRFAYLGVFLGAVLGATVLLGALFAGDSVKASLRRIAENRIGRTTHLVSSGDRFFREALAAELATATQARIAPVLYARGAVTHAGTQLATNRVQLVGLTDAFWQLAPTPTQVPLANPRSAVAINDTLARRLAVSVGDTLVVRIQKPGILAGNAPVAGAEAKLQSLRCTVTAIVDDASFGRFTLETTQVAQPSIFLPIAALQESLGRADKANLLLISDLRSPISDLQAALARDVKLADYGLSLEWLAEAKTFELASDRLFIDPQQAAALSRAVPAAQPAISYLVNELRRGELATPYSIAAATTPAAAPFIPANLGPKEVVINSWLAEDLQAKPGDEVRITYFQLAPGGTLAEQTSAFRVRSIVPLEGLAANSKWMPDFPGITDVNDQSKWDPGLPLHLERIRDKDERYWDDHRGAPKVFLSLEGGRALWSTQWGNTTALRIPEKRENEAALTATLLAALRPEMNQLIVRDLRASAADAAQSPVDFGGLFIGMSFFLILAALGLVAMLFQFVLLQRNREDALLAAVGLSPRTLLRWRLLEGLAILVLGAVVALPMATLYTRGILRVLETIWAGQAAGSTFAFHATPMSIAIGIVAFLGCSLFAIWLATRKLTRRALSIRLAAQTEDTADPARIRKSSLFIALAGFAITIAALGLSNRGIPAQGAFYLAGFALLAAGLGACRWWIALPRAGKAALHPAALGALNLKARRSRSLTVVGLIATAVFMVLSVASFRKHVGTDWLERGSGTGGFAFWIETTAPLNIARDGKAKTFELFERHTTELGEIVPLRAGTGDNANCFNLNTTAQPQLLAVDTTKLAARQAFRIKSPNTAGWSALATPTAAGAIPALVDENTLLWALKRKVGDTLTYTDEAGRSFLIQLVGTLPDSLFQGYVLLDEKLFLEKFPSHPGYGIFLADARASSTPEALTALRAKLETSGRDIGARVELTRDVLASFHQIENTYIAIFNVLGSLGVVLGSLGLAIVVARNLRERRGEFAVLAAIGLPPPVLGRMVFSEFGRLVAWGIVIGSLASLVAILPSLTTLPPAPTLLLVATLLVGIVALNLISGWLIFRWSLRDLRPSVVQAAA